MSQSSRRALFFMTVGLLGLLAVLVVFIVDLSTGGRHDADRAPILETPDEDEIRPLEASVQPALVERALPIHGRVVDGNLAPVEGLELHSGAESARSGHDGRFQFPARVREGPVDLALRSGGDEIARWQSVTVGDTPASPTGEFSTRRPWMLRWSITLTGQPASNSGPNRESAPEESGSADDSVFSGGKQLAGFLEVGAVLVEEWGNSGAVHFAGKVRLPDGTHINSTIFFEDQALVSGARPVEVHDERFQVNFVLPEDYRLYPAAYELRVFYSTTHEDYEQLEKWKITRPDVPWDDLIDYQYSRAIYIGYPEEEIADNRRIHGYYSETVGAVEALWKVLDRQYLDMRKLSRGWDPVLLKDRQEIQESWLRSGAVDIDGRFLEKEWRQFLDDQWRPEVRRLKVRHSQLPAEKFPGYQYRMKVLLDRLGALSQMHSCIIYEHFGLAWHPRDFYYDEYEYQGDQTINVALMRKDLAALKQFVERLAPLLSRPGGDSPR